MHKSPMDFPDELEMLRQFSAARLEQSDPHEGYWVYSVQCANGVELQIHFHMFYHALQIDVICDGKKLSHTYQEGFERIYFDDRSPNPTMRGYFPFRNGTGSVKVTLNSEPLVEWSFIVTNEE